jgi:very-short-patch-repair endonuclease
LRKRSTPAEEILWQYLRNRRLNGLKFYRQFPIGRYITDFYCDELKLAIELEGEIHTKIDQKEYDQIRHNELEAANLKILRFSNDEVNNDIDKVISKILEMARTDPHP